MKTINKFMMLLMVPFALGIVSCTVVDNPVEAVTDDKPFPCTECMDNSVRPGDNFYRYINGQWLDSPNPSPSVFKQVEAEYKSEFNKMLDTCSDPLMVKLRSQAAADMSNDSKNKAIVGERLQMIDKVATADQLYATFDSLQKLGYCPLFRMLALPGDGRTMTNAVVTGGNTEDMSKAFKYANKTELDSIVNATCQQLKSFGFSDGRIAEIAQNAIKVETLEMGAYSPASDMLRYPVQYVRRAPESDNELAYKIMEMIGFTYEEYASGKVGIVSNNIMAVMQNFVAAGKTEEDVKAYRDYMIYNVMAQDAPFLPSVNQQATRNAMMQRALLYNKYYKYRMCAESYGYDRIQKQQCNDILERMRKVFIQRVKDLDWMGEATKAEAIHKAEAMTFYIGYPEQWNDDMTPEADGDCMVAYATQLRQAAKKCNIGLRGRNINDAPWDLLASYASFTTDNAFYSGSLNSLVILPSWITKPRFDNDLSEATLYASAVTFSHEFCHGFDASGSRYDADGVMRNWWQPADEAAFKAKQQIMIELFNQLEAYPGQPANGEKTLVENMADYGGVILSLECYKQRLQELGFKGAQFDEQIKKFFIAYAYSWRYERELSLETLKTLYEIDSHSAAHNRINGMSRLQDDWYRLFDVKSTDKLYLAPEDRVKIW